MWFSQRKRLTPVRVEIQRESIDEPLRNKLWSAIQIAVFDAEAVLYRDRVDSQTLMRRIWLHFFRKPIDTTPYNFADFRISLRTWFFKADWYEVYDILEVFASELRQLSLNNFEHLVNTFLEAEMSAYRLIDGHIAEITNAEEIASIEDAINDTVPLAGVRTHLRDSLAKLTDRHNPDYRNSIKEAISAVESLCQVITGDPRATLGHAIKRIKDAGIKLHPSLEQAWGKLYGYTSDQGGIRHALSDEPNISFSDAKYMLVSCSAFVNHLIQLAHLAGIKLN